MIQNGPGVTEVWPYDGPSFVPRPPDLFNVSRETEGEPGARNHVNNIINNERGGLKPQGFLYKKITKYI